MRRVSFRLISALIGVLLVIVTVEQSNAKAAISRSERCNKLSRQLDEAIETHAKAMQVTAAKALQRQANRFCTSKRQAQGIRTYANALKLLGVAPTDPGQ